MEIPVKESIEIEDGKHYGKISKLEFRSEPFEYVDIYIDLDAGNGNTITIKDGCPATISTKSKLGQTMMRFGCTEKEISENTGKTLDPEKYIKIGTPVEFMTMKDPKSGFSRVVEGSLKPKN